MLYLTTHLRGCFPLSTTVPKNVNKPRLGHLGYTFSENSMDGVESVRLMALPRVETGPHSAQPRTGWRRKDSLEVAKVSPVELGSFLHPEVLPQVPCPHTQTQHPPAFRKREGRTWTHLAEYLQYRFFWSKERPLIICLTPQKLVGSGKHLLSSCLLSEAVVFFSERDQEDYSRRSD